MAACIPLVAQRGLVPPSRSFESISSSRTTTPASSQSGSPASSPTPAQTPPVVYGSGPNKVNGRSILPKSTLKTSPPLSEQLVNQLLQHRASFHKRGFWEEVAILERLYYKNKSQHRQAAHFQKLHECRRLVARIRDLNLAGIVDELVRDFYSGKSLRIIQDLKWDSVPTRQSVAFVMVRIVGQILLLQKMQTTLYKTYGDFYQLMSKTQFMSFSLIAIGLCSRCSVLAKLWSQELVDCYKMLQGWIHDFPQGDRLQLKDIPDYERELPKNIEDLFQESAPEIPPISDVDVAHQQSKHDIGDGDDASVDLGEVIKRPMVIPKVKPSVSVSPAHVPIQEDLIARVVPAAAGAPVVTKDMEKDILSELGSIFSKPSPKSSPKTSAKSTAISATTTVETKVIKVKKVADASINDIFSSLDNKADTLGSKKKKKKKRPLDSETQSASGAEESSDTSMPVTAGARSAHIPRALNPPTPDRAASSSSLKQKGPGSAADQSPQEKAKSKKLKASSLLSNFDDIFGGASSSSGNTAPNSALHGSDRSGGAPAKKQKVSQFTPKGGKDEIDDLFGSMAPKTKKPKLDLSAEIDSIFGAPKKKKKRGL
ncbi:hypothetical protein DFQ26_004532 [Actinomortierella ambigua]|nr:hypothetical protein DFQ26_004532 [Actinomortierella ambigua]